MSIVKFIYGMHGALYLSLPPSLSHSISHSFARSQTHTPAMANTHLHHQVDTDARIWAARDVLSPNAIKCRPDQSRFWQIEFEFDSMNWTWASSVRHQFEMNDLHAFASRRKQKKEAKQFLIRKLIWIRNSLVNVCSIWYQVNTSRNKISKSKGFRNVIYIY